jgi:alkylhydroperoxidase family enzyme
MGETSDLKKAAQRAILEGEARSTREERRRAYDGEGADGAVARYVAKVRDHAYKVVDEDIAALREAGLDDDRIFELTVATAVGQATRQYDAAVAALDEALAGTAGDASAGAGAADSEVA